MNELDKKILKVATKAVKEAQIDSLQRGIANVYSKNKRLYFQLPDGTITEQEPKAYQTISGELGVS
ncbi:MAG: hypothetical protein P1P78_05855 [Methyloprofundus sp.]|nr:hypothetical protein [Methyloprofundus sp.]